MVLSYRHTRLVCSLKAGEKIHKKLLTNVLRGPMSFFDSTPIGRIVNRFSKDINSVDFGLPDQLGNMFDAVVSIICTILVIVYNIPIFVIVIVPLTIIYLVVQVNLDFCFCSLQRNILVLFIFFHLSLRFVPFT